MFARVTTYDVPLERISEATAAFQPALDQIRSMPGLIGAHLLVSVDSGRVLTMTLWESRQAMEASRVAASRLRSDAVRPIEGSVLSTDEYEVEGQQFG